MNGNTAVLQATDDTGVQNSRYYWNGDTESSRGSRLHFPQMVVRQSTIAVRPRQTDGSPAVLFRQQATGSNEWSIGYIQLPTYNGGASEVAPGEDVIIQEGSLAYFDGLGTSSDWHLIASMNMSCMLKVETHRSSGDNTDVVCFGSDSSDPVIPALLPPHPQDTNVAYDLPRPAGKDSYPVRNGGLLMQAAMPGESFKNLRYFDGKHKPVDLGRLVDEDHRPDNNKEATIVGERYLCFRLSAGSTDKGSEPIAFDLETR